MARQPSRTDGDRNRHPCPYLLKNISAMTMARSTLSACRRSENVGATNVARYELVDGRLIEMPPASFKQSDIIDFIADCFKAIAREYKLDIKVKTGDVGVKTGMNSCLIPDILVIDGQVWKSCRRDKSAVIAQGVMLAVEVVSPLYRTKRAGLHRKERSSIESLVFLNIGLLTPQSKK